MDDDLDRLTPPVGPRDHRQGPDDAPVTLVEYGDFECPYCGRAHPIIKEVQRALGDRLQFVFRNFPIATKHPHAQHAAEAAEAAGAQGKFWEMHDILYENQQALDDDSLVEYAGSIGLDVELFVHEMSTHRYTQRVREDFRSGINSGVNGTPTFFINGLRYDRSWDLRSLTEALLAAAEEAMR
ncbi:MAG: DsbA family protein [Chloroflexia bacterium]